jgi:Uma2 family endonuclease
MADMMENENSLFTYKDYKAWELKSGERYELIHGTAYGMSGATTMHQRISGVLFNKLYNYLEGKECEVFSAPYDVRLFYKKDESDTTVVQPDIMVICDKDKIGNEGCRGAPDFIVEIVSPSNGYTYMKRKYSLYEYAGVKEYWVIDPALNTIETFNFKDVPVSGNKYNEEDTVCLSLFPGLKIRLKDIFKG